MEHMPYPDLEKVIANAAATGNKIPVETTVRWMIQILQAMQKAHEDEGIFHRDLKPSNVFCAQREGVEYMVIADFGNAKVLDDNLSASLQNVTRSGDMSGTPEYLAPEATPFIQLRELLSQDDKKDWLARFDIYAIGCIMYELLALTQPVKISASNPIIDFMAFGFPMVFKEEVEAIKRGAATVSQVMAGKIASHTLQSRFAVSPIEGLDPALSNIIEKMMARNPYERYQTTTDALNALFKYYHDNFLFGR